ncbi:hypothetical protein H4582DRAFT_2086668 [Lactarius indigo]|nr:hypothetical protein H4582DRAFT_2086668 [Lactarius indigo]
MSPLPCLTPDTSRMPPDNMLQTPHLSPPFILPSASALIADIFFQVVKHFPITPLTYVSALCLLPIHLVSSTSPSQDAIEDCANLYAASGVREGFPLLFRRVLSSWSHPY